VARAAVAHGNTARRTAGWKPRSAGLEDWVNKKGSPCLGTPDSWIRYAEMPLDQRWWTLNPPLARWGQHLADMLMQPAHTPGNWLFRTSRRCSTPPGRSPRWAEASC